MHHPTLLRRSLLLLVLGSAGCQEFFTLEEACVDGFTGKGQLDDNGVEAFNRMNCYRRLSGVTKASGSSIVVEAADNEMNYIVLNPDPTLLGGSEGIGGYLTQTSDRPGFTGISVRERLVAVNYAFYDPINTIADEVIGIHYKKAGEADYTPTRAVDEMMRLVRMRQTIQQPSWLDGGYAQQDLDKDWLVAAGVDDAESATVYYFIAIFTVPHLEHANTPVLLPKEDQEEVPLYSNTFDYTDFYNPVPARISWPISFLVGTLDQDNYNAVDQNPYEVKVISQSLTNKETGELVPTHVVHPGDELSGVYPDGNLQRWIVGIFADHPYEPLTKYNVVAEMDTVDGTFNIDYDFTTMAAADDPDFTKGTPLPPPTTPTSARVAPASFFTATRTTELTSPVLGPLPVRVP
jgi:hypothetical protein